MKKLLAVLMLCGVTTVAFAAEQFEFLDNMLTEAMQQSGQRLPHSSSSHDKGVILAKLTVSSDIVDQDRVDYANLDPLIKDCPLVRISENYMLGSYACVGLSDEGTIQHSTGGSGGHISERTAVRRHIDKVQIGDVSVPGRNVIASKNNKLFLVNTTNVVLPKEIKSRPVVNLFIPNDPQKLKDTFEQVVLNRDKSWPCNGRTCSEVSITKVCSSNGCFKVSAWTKGDSGDPIFGMNTYSSEEFLLGFNVTDVDISDRQSGKYYHFFTQDTWEFLKANIETKSPSDWADITRKKVSESYFENK